MISTVLELGKKEGGRAWEEREKEGELGKKVGELGKREGELGKKEGGRESLGRKRERDRIWGERGRERERS